MEMIIWKYLLNSRLEVLYFKVDSCDIVLYVMLGLEGPQTIVTLHHNSSK